jgi:hypothetical protein
MKKLSSFAVFGAIAIGVPSCQDSTRDEVASVSVSDGETTSMTSLTGPSTSLTTSADDTTTVADETTTGGGTKLDTLQDTTGGPVNNCQIDGDCVAIDLLFVIDNSGTMGEEQLNLAQNFPLLIQQLQGLTDSAGVPVYPSVNVMVTTTDFGHPLCTQFEKPDYEPRRGAPVYEGCNARINRFTGLGNNPLVLEEACTTNCPTDLAPADQFIHFDVGGSNVPLDNVAQALSCIGPQGIDGCGYEAQLESMLQALNPEACWNNPDTEACEAHPEWGQFNKPFLRDGALLAIAMVTDEAECSVAAPGGFTYFTNPDNNQYWEINPNGDAPQVSSAVCWNAGVSCSGPDATGLYTDCVSTDNGVLHPTERYISYLDYLVNDRNKDVVMLGILGVPEVTAHNPMPPYEPIAGGVFALVDRIWTDEDLTPAEVKDNVTVEEKMWEFGNIAPGCLNDNGSAIFPHRIQEVCESLNVPDDPETQDIDESAPRCCIESICDDDFSAAVRCLTGAISSAIPPAG